MRWIAPWIGLAAACSTPGRGTAPLGAAELEALLARTNALRSFHATYDFVQGPPADAYEDFELELAYQAPERAYVRFAGPYEVFESWCTGERIVVHTRSAEQGERWKALDLPEHGQRSAAGGVVLCLSWPGLGEGSDFGAWLGYRAGRTSPLDWLRFLAPGSSAGLDGRRIHWTGAGFRCWLEAASGLPEWLEFRTRDGFEFRLELEERTLDEPLAPRLLEPPPASAAAEPFTGAGTGLDRRTPTAVTPARSPRPSSP